MPQTVCAEFVQAWTRLMRAEQGLMDKIEAALKQAGLPPLAWYDVLDELDRSTAGRLPQSDVQTRLAMAQYNLCRLADRLAADGLVERTRCIMDGRKGYLAITARGREMRSTMWPVYAGAIKAHVAGRLTHEEADHLARLLGKLLDTPCGCDPQTAETEKPAAERGGAAGA